MKISGIYKIVSIISPDKIYIGSAINIQKRWTNHLHKLRNNIHHSQKLQNHFNKYGEFDLSVELVEECSMNEKFSKEQYYLDLYDPWFNICKIAGSTCGRITSEETKIKLKNKSDEAKYNWRKSRSKNNYSQPKELDLSGSKFSLDHIEKLRKVSVGIPVIQYDLDNNFIKEWPSIKGAARSLRVYPSGIAKCIKGKFQSSYGYIWKYK